MSGGNYTYINYKKKNKNIFVLKPKGSIKLNNILCIHN